MIRNIAYSQSFKLSPILQVTPAYLNIHSITVGFLTTLKE